MHHPAHECAERRKHTLALSTRQAARENVKHSRPGSDGQQHSRRKKKKKPRLIEHNDPRCCDVASTSPESLPTVPAIPRAETHHRDTLQQRRTIPPPCPRCVRPHSPPNTRPLRKGSPLDRPSSVAAPRRRSRDAVSHGPHFLSP